MDVKENFMFVLEDKVKFIPSKRCLIAEDGSTVELTDNSHRMLLLLLEGQTDKTEIINHVWIKQRGAVSDSSYYGQIYLLRKSFREAGLPENLIKTIPRKGVEYVGHASKMLEEELTGGSGTLKENSEDQQSEGKPKKIVEWYNSRQWNVFVSLLAMLAVCWLTSLCFIFLVFIKG